MLVLLIHADFWIKLVSDELYREAALIQSALYNKVLYKLFDLFTHRWELTIT